MQMTNYNILLTTYFIIFKILSIFIFICILLCSQFVIFKLIFESNHISINPYILVNDILIIILFYLINIIFPRTRKIALLILFLCISSLIIIYALDKFNLLVEYHEWIQRGMPEKPWQ